ncbi:MAG: 23S rRNA pseudouridine(1911/1915/1917) synthase RluD [Gammaproteobacteria bacterium]|nr:23S rRNA pseudouridine(1911/1915/1917) synthase RluD [Gammaproteobacteria bacterium]
MKTIKLNSSIPIELEGQRLDQALAQLFPDYSRSLIKSWIQNGQVKVNQTTQTVPRSKVRTEQIIDIEAELIPAQNWQGQDLPLDVIYEDKDIIVINKPIGVVSHPGAGNPDKTLVNALLHHDPELNNLPRAGLIHRLDKDTSGLLVIARNLASHNHLIQAMQAREIHREYQTIVNGHIISGGSIEAPIGRHPSQRTKMSVVTGGKPAITHYRVIKRFQKHTHLQVILETGRTHQIRVHFAHIKHPLVGDKAYSRPYHHKNLPPELTDALHHFKHQALHAGKLELKHPISGEAMCFEAPLPEDMQQLLVQLRKDLEQSLP